MSRMYKFESKDVTDALSYCTLQQAITFLEGERKKLEQSSCKEMRLTIETEYEYGESYARARLSWERPETDEEMATRIAAAEKVLARTKKDAEERRLRKEEDDRREFLRLQEKFKDNPELWRK